MKTKAFLVVLLSVLCLTGIFAQKSGKKLTITGMVTDSDNKPVANAIIMIDNKNTSTMTDQKGIYKIKVKPEAAKIGVITFSLGVKEEDIADRDTINFSYAVVSEEPAEMISESPGDAATDVGYGTLKKKYVSNQVSKIDGTNKKYASYSSISDMIQREVSGVRISNGTIVIHDSKDLFGSIPALIVLDGVYIDGIPDIAPVQVLSIEVLKGSSAAMYGSRGFGGVIIIKSKIQND
jgi:TonB-dependent SusC/RagA subfamily outer membrane receptor